jgi:hypothetical protein
MEHKLLWAKETILLTIAAAHVPAWLWLPLSGTGWLAMHVVLPVTLALLLWLAWRAARTELGRAGRVSLPGLAASVLAAALLAWGLLSVVPVFSSVGIQTASFVIRSGLAALLATGLVLLPFAAREEGGM